FRLTDEIRLHKPTARSVLSLIAVCLFASLVKYAFLPIFLGVGMYFVLLLYRNYQGKFRSAAAYVWHDWLKRPRLANLVLTAGCVLGVGMFIQRDGVNLVKYHEIVPDCGQVLSVQTCSAYSAWYFTYNSHQLVLEAPQPSAVEHYNPITY